MASAWKLVLCSTSIEARAEAMPRLCYFNTPRPSPWFAAVAAAKNIILAGVKRVVLYDPEDVRISDLGANFYLSETDVGRNRAEACFDKLRELNTAVAVEPVTGTLSHAHLTAVDVRISVISNDALLKLHSLAVPCSSLSHTQQTPLATWRAGCCPYCIDVGRGQTG